MIITNPYTIYETPVIAQIDGTVVQLPTAMTDIDACNRRNYDTMYKDELKYDAYDKVKDPWAVDAIVKGSFIEIGNLSINMNDIKTMEYIGVKSDSLRIYISDQIYYDFDIHGVRNFRQIKEFVYKYFEQKDKRKYYE